MGEGGGGGEAHRRELEFMHQYQIPEMKFHLHALAEGVFARSFLSKHR